MNHRIARRLLFIAASLAVFTLTGCTTLRPISSKPPRATIVLSAPFTTSWWEGLLPPLKYRLSLPAGEYRPVLEDDQYYYYQSPSKIVYSNLGSSLFDGGMYVPRGATTPRGWYFVDQDGSQQTGEFKTPPPIR
jgi:hypothetical protein